MRQKEEWGLFLPSPPPSQKPVAAAVVAAETQPYITRLATGVTPCQPLLNATMIMYWVQTPFPQKLFRMRV